LESHLLHEQDRLHAQGYTEGEARRRARLHLGNPTLTAEDTRAQWRFSSISSVAQDLRFAARLMRRNPVFTIAAILSLALGIGATTAVFSVFDKVLFGALPVESPETLVRVQFEEPNTSRDRIGEAMPYPYTLELQRNAKTLTDVSCSSGARPSLSERGGSRLISAELVCGNYFQTLGLRPQLGRLLTPADNQRAGEHTVAVLSHHFWQSEYAGDPNIVGRTITLSRVPFVVVGVAPEGFFSVRKSNAPAVFVPIVMDGVMYGGPTGTNFPGSYWLAIFARKPASLPASAVQAELTPGFREYRRVNAEGPFSDYQKKVEAGIRIVIEDASRGIDSGDADEQYGKPFLLLMAVVATVLLIACINIANLLLARASARQREISTRLAIGASRPRLIRQFFTESVALAALGGVAGIALSLALEHWLLREGIGISSLLLSTSVPAPKVLAFAAAITALSAIVFGLLPACVADRQGLNARSKFAGRKLLVSLQVALSIMLLMAAGIFLKTIQNLRAVDTGFDRAQMVSLMVRPELSGLSRDAFPAYYRQVEERVAQVPGVRGVMLMTIPIVDFSQWGSGLQIAGQEVPPGEPSPMRNTVGPNLFTALRARMLEGRDFLPSDNSPNAPKVAIINESFARRYFPGVSPLGKHIGPGNKAERPRFQIIGVVRDLLDNRIQEKPERYWYVPYLQQTRIAAMVIAARVDGSTGEMLKRVRAAVSEVNRVVPITRERTMEENVETQIRQEKVIAQLCTLFGAIAALLAVIGLYGVMAYTVERRTREIGIRIALGETQTAVLWRILREALLYLGIGAAIGIPLALGLGRFAEKLLYGVPAQDWTTLSASILAVSSAGALAGFVSAKRAAAIEPWRALRTE
jgi:predicted permease